LTDLSGQCALVTGGSGAIGSAIARALLAGGASVTLMARDPHSLAETRARLLEAMPRGDVHTFAGDGCDAGAVQAAVEFAHASRNRLDIAVCTVGQGAFSPLLEERFETFEAALRRNITSAFLGIRYAAPLMTAGGSIVCISSTVARRPALGMCAYAAAKAGLEGLVRNAAAELAARNIRVNAVRPGATLSKLRQDMFDDPAIRRRFTDEIPLGRIGRGEDVAGAVRYLVGADAQFVTGQIVAVDGGAELRRQPDIADLLPPHTG
jgi:NAD(P)-dependent dehydrogenase (short-subunit alcohol dehydrogenase family)